MAVNKSNNPKGVNGGDDDFGMSELRRIGESASRLTGGQKEDLERYQQAVEKLEVFDSLPVLSQAQLNDLARYQSMLEATKEAKNKKPLQARIEKLVDATQSDPWWVKAKEKASQVERTLWPKIEMNQKSTLERLNTQATNAVNRNFSEPRVNGAISDSLANSTTQGRALVLRNSVPYEELATQQSNYMAQAAILRNESVNIAGEYVRDNNGALEVNPDAQDRLKANAAAMKELVGKLGPITGGLKMYKDAGLDPESKARNVAHQAEKAQELLAFQGLQKDIANGDNEYGNLSPAEFKKKEAEAATNLVKALDALSKSADKTDKEIADLTKAAEEAAEKFEEVQEASAAGAGSKKGSTAETVSTYATAIGQLASQVGQWFQALGVNMPMMKMGNMAGYAAIENQKHDGWRSALAGNMTERLNLAAWADARAFGENRGKWADRRSFSDVIGGGAAAVGGVAQGVAAGLGTAGTVLGNNVVKNVAEAGVAASEGARMAAVNVYDQANKVSYGQADLAGQQAYMDFARKVNHIPGYQLQQYRNHIGGLHAPSTMMGSRGENFLAQTSSAEFLQGMQMYGTSSEDVANLSMQGVQSLGSQFDASQILQAQRYENLGLGSTSDQIRRMAALSPGSQNPSESLEKMLSTAMTVGMDDSKALNAVADSTGQMAEKNAMSGFKDTSDELMRVLLSAADRSNPNQGFAAQQAAAVHQNNQQARNDRSVSFHGMAATDRIQNALGVSFEQASILQGMDSSYLRTLQGKSEKDIQAAFWKFGIDSKKFKDAKGAIGTVLNSQEMSQLEANGGIGTNVASEWADYIRPWALQDKKNLEALRTRKAENLPSDIAEHMRRMNEGIALSGRDSDAEVRDLLATFHTDVNQTPLGDGQLGDGSKRNDLTREVKRSAVQNAKAGEKALGGLDPTGTNGISEIAAGGDAIAKVLGEKAEEYWGTAAANAAADFGVSARSLTSAGDKLMEAANKLLEVAGGKKAAGAVNVDEPPDDKKTKKPAMPDVTDVQPHGRQTMW